MRIHPGTVAPVGDANEVHQEFPEGGVPLPVPEGGMVPLLEHGTFQPTQPAHGAAEIEQQVAIPSSSASYSTTSALSSAYHHFQHLLKHIFQHHLMWHLHHVVDPVESTSPMTQDQ